MTCILDQINQPNDIKKIPEDKLPALAQEIRDFLIENISHTGGHLASNLGTVELTIALHRVCTLPEDRIVWDVGHQAYTHKILTGRKDQFHTLRQQGGLSGFPRRRESSCDAFDTGHSSTAVSAGLGYVHARDLKGGSGKVISVLGDGALTGGMVYEAINNAARLKTNFVIVLNDNKMSISKNVGGISDYLGQIRTSASYTWLKMGVSSTLKKIPKVGDAAVEAVRKTKSSIKQLVIPGMMFENMGLTYLGPVDGHNIAQTTRVLEEAVHFPGPVLVHVITEKGRGYLPAAKHPEHFHGIAPFEVVTGMPLSDGGITYTDAFSAAMVEFGKQYPDLAAITAAMREGTGLKRFEKAYPDRFYDTGIAEEHAVTFAAGLALGGMRPVVAVYSSFLQRGFDQIMEDVCMQDLPVVFAVDRAGLVGADGRTHQGMFDLSYLSMLPGMTVMAPKNKWELHDMLQFALELGHPAAIRYPRGEAWDGLAESRAKVEYGRGEVLHTGKGTAILAVGAMVRTAEEAWQRLHAEGLDVTLVNMRFIKPLDETLIRELAGSHSVLVTMEENVRHGGFGQQVQDLVSREQLPARVEILAAPDCYVGHGTVSQQRKALGLDGDTVTDRVRALAAEGQTTTGG